MSLDEEKQFLAESAKLWLQCDTAHASINAPHIRTGPTMNKGKSEQIVATPPEFIAAVERRFGKLDWDLAATADNAKAPRWITPEQDALSQDWLMCQGNCWLNPPFGDIKPWAFRASIYGCAERHIFMLTPASVSTNWFHDYVYRKAYVLAVQRIKFIGHKADYPKDMILSCYGLGVHGFDVWKWK